MSAVTAPEGSGRHEATGGGQEAIMAMPLAEFLETAAALSLTPAELMGSLAG